MADFTFKEMQDQVGRFIQDVGAGRKTRIQESINRRYLETAREEKWVELNEFEFNLTTVASSNDSAFLYLPKRVDLVYKIIQGDTPEILQATNFGLMAEQRFFTLTQGGNAMQYAPMKDSAIKESIATAELINAVSSASGDTSGITLVIKGRVGDDTVKESLTINGTVSVQSTNSFTDIFSISVDGSRTGILTMTGATSSTEYATIAPLEVASRYPQYRVYPVGTSSSQYSLFYKRRVTPLVDDGDVPEIPIDLGLIELSIADILRQQNRDQGANIHEARGNKIIRGVEAQRKMQGENIEVSQPRSINRRISRPIVTVNNTN